MVLEQIELTRGYGPIEGRKRFKHGSHPLLEKRTTSNLYVDECGQSFGQRSNQAPLFVLAGVAMSPDAVSRYVEAANAIKRDFFGTTDMTFHEPALRKRDGPYYFEGDLTKQQALDRAIDGLVCSSDATAFGIAIRKDAYRDYFEQSGLDPNLPTDLYAVGIMMLLERYVDFLATSSMPVLGRVTFESQGPREDAFHQLEFARVLLDGSQWVSDSTFRNWLEPGLRFAPKGGSHPLELADIFARDIYDWVRSGCTTAPRSWDTISAKVYVRGSGLLGKFGVKIFPDSDVREQVLAHRIACGAEI